MGGSPLIERYTSHVMRALWSDEMRLARMLEVELVVSEELARVGIIPRDAAHALREKARLDPERIAAIEAEVHHDVIAFTTQVAESVGPEGRFLHYGLTSTDVVDTAQALAIRQALTEIRSRLADLRTAVRERATHEAHTPTVGRTHGIHAEPTTFGLKLARHDSALGRDSERLAGALKTISVGKLSGAVGTFNHIPPHVEAAALHRLGLVPEPVAGQVLGRDRHAEVLCTLAILAGDLDNLATEIRHLARTEIGEALEPFGQGQKGSSAMPHKRNPIHAEKVSGLARLVRGYALSALEEIALWHERDISHSSVERVILPDATTAVDHMLSVLTRLVQGWELHPERMAQNLALTDGRVHSESVLLALVAAGVDRDQAYRTVQRAALDPSPGFADRLRADPLVRDRLGPGTLEGILSSKGLDERADEILARVGLRAKATD